MHRPIGQVRGFTLVEIVVVTTIVVILIAAAGPAFSGMLASQERTAAESRLQGALAAARETAVRSGPGEDAAAVFIFEPAGGGGQSPGGRLTIVTAVKVGQLADRDWTVSPTAVPNIVREVFVPVGVSKPVELPRGWMVRGYAGDNLIDGEWYEPTSGETRYGLGAPAWVFPETGFYSRNVQNPSGTDTGFSRQTFMVRFQGGSGNIVTGERFPAVVVLPRPSSSGRGPSGVVDRSNLWSVYRLDEAANLRNAVSGILARPWLLSSDPAAETAVETANRRIRLLGDRSSDTVLARSLTELALYDEQALAQALGVNVDRVSDTIYAIDETAWLAQAPATGGNADIRPQYVGQLRGNPQTTRRINRWIERWEDLDDPSSQATTTDRPVELFTIDRFAGALRPMTVPTTSTGNP